MKIFNQWKNGITRYLKESILFFLIVIPILISFRLVGTSVVDIGNFKDLSFINLIVLTLLMKEIAYWIYIKEIIMVQKTIKKCLENNFFERLRFTKTFIGHFIFLLRTVAKGISLLFIFVMAHTWLHLIDVELEKITLLLSSIVFYMGIELRTVIKVAYFEHQLNKKVLRKEIEKA